MRNVFILFAVASSSFAFAADSLNFMAQSRAEQPDGSYQVIQTPTAWAPDETAIIVCDMWDDHWCGGAAARVAEMAPRMNDVLERARGMGVRIIHAPSGTMDQYEDTPARDRAKNAPHADLPNEDSWKYIDPEKEGPLPIDDSDGGCDCDPPCEDVNVRRWSRQIETLRIDDSDAVSDSGQEVYNLLEAESRDNVIVMGVHTNMCVLGRPFSIRAQVNNGKNVVLMRDLTDTMYNSRMKPFVNHHRGTDLVVAHIEKHWAPTITSSVFLAQAPNRFEGDERPHIVFVIHEQEYETATTVPAFAEKEIAEEFGWRCTYLIGDKPNYIPGLEAVEDADLLFISVRRQILPAEDLAYIRAHCEAGKPVVGIRTSSHAFALRKGPLPEGGADWPEFDADILGGNYTGHHGNDLKATAWAIEEAADHPVLQGVDPKPWVTGWSLYKTSPLADTTTPLMMGEVEDRPTEPVAWTNINKHGGRVFYTSLGHVDDFNNKNFRRMLVNGIVWALNSEQQD